MPLLLTAPLVGRAADLDVLNSAFAETAVGATRTVVLSGESGIGKSRLIDEFVAGLPESAVIARGQCVDLDTDAPPFAPVIAVLRALAARVGNPALVTAAGPARDALAVILPELAPGTPEPAIAEDPAVGDRVARDRAWRDREWRDRAGRERLDEAVAAVLDNLALREAGGPASAVHSAGPRRIVVVIEDLHWADRATLGMLRFLVRMVETAPVLFLFSVRSDDVRRGSPLSRWLPELDRSRRVIRRQLARLTPVQVRQLMTSLLGAAPSASEAADVHKRTDGVPFFVEELACCDGALGTAGYPDTLREILLARYDTVSDETQRVLRLIAAGGARVEHQMLAAVYPGTAEAIDAAVTEAIRGNILLVDTTAYAFRHALVRDAIHDQLLPGERVRFHTEFARALESGVHGRADATEISYHWMAAHNVRNAFMASLEAMRAAHDSYAHGTAALMGERAIELWPQVPDAEQLAGQGLIQLLTTTAYALRNAGESERAIQLVDEALASGAPIDAETRARILRDKASYLANVGEIGSIDLLRQALAALADSPSAVLGAAVSGAKELRSSVLRANVLGELAARLMLDARFDEAIEMADAAFAEAFAVESRARMSVAANIRGISRISAGDITGGLADLDLAGELGIGDDSARLRYWVNESDALNLLGRYTDAIRVAEAGVERARQRGVERTSGAMLLSNVIGPLFSTGETARAQELLDRALELDPPLGFSAHLERLALRFALWKGDLDSADRLLRGWSVGLSRQSRIDAQSRLELAQVATQIALERGRVADAWAEVRDILRSHHQPFPAYDLPFAAVAARVLAAVIAEGTPINDDGGFDPVAVEGRIRDLAERSAAWPTAPASLALIDAELGGGDRRGGDAAAWRCAVAALEHPGSPAQLLPYALYRLAESLAASGDRAGALGHAAEAGRRAREIGAGLIVMRVADLERRAGVRAGGSGGGAGATPDGGSAAALAGLTDRERQVLGLMVQGLSNRQVADRLFISPKTASAHVSNILRKAGAATRTEAVFVLSPPAVEGGALFSVEHAAHGLPRLAEALHTPAEIVTRAPSP